MLAIEDGEVVDDVDVYPEVDEEALVDLDGRDMEDDEDKEEAHVHSAMQLAAADDEDKKEADVDSALKLPAAEPLVSQCSFQSLQSDQDSQVAKKIDFDVVADGGEGKAIEDKKPPGPDMEPLRLRRSEAVASAKLFVETPIRNGMNAEQRKQTLELLRRGFCTNGSSPKRVSFV